MSKNVGQVITSVSEWVELHGKQIPGFRGAHLLGSILTLPHEAPFPSYRDVDLNIVCDELTDPMTHDVAYNGLILEYGTVSSERYRTPEDVLANPELAANLAAGGILADPYGLLAPLQQAVAAQYAHQRWVVARCSQEKQMVSQVLGGLQHAAAPAEASWLLSSGALFLSGLLAEASLRAPTHRRCLVLMREVLHAHGHAELHEAILRLLGFAHLSRQQVDRYLRDCAETFDQAVAVTRTPVPFQFKLQPHIRPYIIDGAQELIGQGYHREAMFWIGGFLIFANTAIQCDAPAAKKPHFQAKVDQLIEEIGLGTPADIAARASAAQDLAAAIFGIADDLAERSPA